MQLTITPEAKEKLNRINKENNQYLVLWYDTEGCGRGVNGMPTIRFTNKKTPLDLEVKNDSIPILINEQQTAFFAKNMKLNVVNGMFRLSSPEGILNPFISQQSVCEL